MNFIAATLYLNLQNEEDTYWMLLYILKDMNYGAIYTPGLKVFQLRCDQLESLISKHLPQIYQHFV